MKIYRNNVGIEMTLDEFINLIEDESRVYGMTDLITTLEEEEISRENEAMFLPEDFVTPYDLPMGDVGVLERPPAINQYFINMAPSNASVLGEDYLDELKQLESDELVKIRKIIERFGSLLD